MTRPAADLYRAIDGTWPALRYVSRGPWMLRHGDGGGKRVSATTATRQVEDRDIRDAEAAMTEMGQDHLFMLHPDQGALDGMLAELGYDVVDPVTLFACPTQELTTLPIPRVTVFNLWEPLAIMHEIWAQGGLDPARLRIMDRVTGPKTALLSRLEDKPAGVAFVAVHDGIAMVHALDVLPHQQRKGAAGWMMRGAAFWAEDHGAETLATLCVDTNAAAKALYGSLGMPVAGHYHYRLKAKERP